MSVPSLSQCYYCIRCEEIIGTVPWTHRDEVHDGERGSDFSAFIQQIRYTTGDGAAVAIPDGWYHEGHFWHEIEGHVRCPDCGGVEIPSEEIRAFRDGGGE